MLSKQDFKKNANNASKAKMATTQRIVVFTSQQPNEKAVLVGLLYSKQNQVQIHLSCGTH